MLQTMKRGLAVLAERFADALVNVARGGSPPPPSDLLQQLEEIGQMLGADSGQVIRTQERARLRFRLKDRWYTLAREERPGFSRNAACVVEAEALNYSGPELALGQRAGRAEPWRRALPIVVRVPFDEFDRRFVAHTNALACGLDEALADAETRRAVSYALDRHAAQLRLTARACWYECVGFPDNAEQAAATARTAAGALSALLDRLEPRRAP